MCVRVCFCFFSFRPVRGGRKNANGINDSPCCLVRYFNFWRSIRFSVGPFFSANPISDHRFLWGSEFNICWHDTFVCLWRLRYWWWKAGRCKIGRIIAAESCCGGILQTAIICPSSVVCRKVWFIFHVFALKTGPHQLVFVSGKYGGMWSDVVEYCRRIDLKSFILPRGMSWVRKKFVCAYVAKWQWKC